VPVPEEPLVNYWYRALHSPLGVELICSEFEPTRQKLYALRREVHDEALADISLCQSPFDSNRLWLVKQKSADETP
jgi:hypothetical protein